MLADNMLGAADQDMIAADHLLDLPRWAGAVVDENNLTLAHLSHWRFLFEHLRGRRYRRCRCHCNQRQY